MYDQVDDVKEWERVSNELSCIDVTMRFSILEVEMILLRVAEEI